MADVSEQQEMGDVSDQHAMADVSCPEEVTVNMPAPSLLYKRSSTFMELSSIHGELGKEPATLAWKDLTFSAGKKQIIKGVTGILEPNSITALMGPSGSAKTTLLNVLSGRQRTSGGGLKMGGQVFWAGKQMQPANFRKQVAYVFQDTALSPTETPRDCLEFSAFLRLSVTVSDKERAMYVEKMLDNLNLTNCADNLVGNAAFKGISGGQLKRTAVGVELISNPKQIFLDEPLSGLDSFNAVELVQLLQALSRSGVPVLMTLHQPGSEVFAMLDHIVILHSGAVCFQGPAAKLGRYFRGQGFSVPPNHKPTDIVLFLVQTETPEVIQSMKDNWLQSDMGTSLLSKVTHATTTASSNAVSDRMPSVTGRRCFCATLKELLARDARATRRSWFFWFFQLVLIKLVTNAIWGVLFWRMGVREDRMYYSPNCSADNYDKLECMRQFVNHFSALGLICICYVLDSLNLSVQLYHSERAMFLRESAGGYYDVTPYFLSKMILESFLTITATLFSSLAAYWMIGFRMSFAELLFGTWLLSLTSASLMWISSAYASTREQAMNLGMLPWILQFAMSGIPIAIKDIPPWIQWAKWICPLFYGQGLLAVTEFRYLFTEADQCAADSSLPGCRGVMTRMSILNEMEYKIEYIWWPYLTMCLVLLVVYRALATIILWRNSKYAV